MLLQLNIENFALIQKLSISFNKGFNVLLGETGAGKSILIDAIDYVLGGKFEKSLIRTGENKTFVEALFTIENSKIKNKLLEMDIELEDDILIVRRETFKNGKNIAKVNGKSFLISQLRVITSMLMNIHGQHQNQDLLNEDNYLRYIDDFGDENFLNRYEKYKKMYIKWVEVKNKIEKLKGDRDKEKLVDFLKYQIDEIEQAQLKKEEDIELENKYKVLSNYEKINSNLNECYEILNNGYNNHFAICDSLAIVLKNLEEIKNSYDNVNNTIESMKDIYYNLQECTNEIRDIKDSIYYDKNELDNINNRIYIIDSLKRKYGNTIEEILEYKNRIFNQYNEIINGKEVIEKLIKEKEVLETEMKKQCSTLHKIRCNIAENLSKNVQNELNYVGLDKSKFEIKVKYNESFNQKGKDYIKFNMSTNPGEPLKELHKVVSGGELSRIMLALKAVFVDNDDIPSIIFDEIDTGISGRIAQRVGEKMYMISKKHQVFCITHLPQIAVMSDNHYLVKKYINNNKTFTLVKEINSEEKEMEIAKMIGGDNVTEITLKNAREMIKITEQRKHQI